MTGGGGMSFFSYTWGCYLNTSGVCNFFTSFSYDFGSPGFSKGTTGFKSSLACGFTYDLMGLGDSYFIC